ncbi:MAG: type II secretion system F family protein [Bacillota bacterium]|nr:type II secretion system F family protein [Bacillota bacterium]
MIANPKKADVKLLAACAAGAVGLTYLFYHSAVLSAVSLVLAFPLARLWSQRREEQLRRRLSWQFRDLLYSLSGSFATGRQMKEALEEAEENLKLIYGPEEPIRREVSRMVREMREQKASDEQVWQDFALRSRLEDVRSFAEVYSVCKHSGGNLERVVMKGTEILAEKISIHRDIHAMTVQKQWEARILTAMPLLVIFFLQLSSPDYMEVMYRTLTGRLLMTLALLAIGGAYLWSLKLTEIEV